MSRTKHTVVVGRVVLQTVEIEVEAELDAVETAALAAAKEIPDKEFVEACTPNIPEELFVVTSVDHDEVAFYELDEPPEKQKPLQEAIDGDLARGEGKIVGPEWIHVPGDEEYPIPEAVRDWVQELKELAKSAPASKERKQPDRREVFG